MARLSSSRASDLEHSGPELAHPAGQPSPRSTVRLLLVSLRPEQWTKNLIVFAGLLFGGRLLDWNAILLAVATFVIFCALSGAVYLFNDVADRDADKQHPLKRMRPIPSGQLPVKGALVAGGVLGGAAVETAFLISPQLGLLAGAYLVLLTFYSVVLKNIVI